LYNYKTKSVIISRDVTFKENTQDQGGVPQIRDNRIFEFQPSLLENDQIQSVYKDITQNDQELEDEDLDEDNLEFYNFESEFSNPDNVLQEVQQSLRRSTRE